MIRRNYLILSLVAALGLGAVFARAGVIQKDKKEKGKDQTEYKQKDSGRAEGFRDTGSSQYFALPLLGEGSYLGVFLEEVTSERVKELGLAEERGAIIMKVAEGSPAEKAGLKENDVIITFNGRRVDSVKELQRLMSETPAGRSVPIEIARGGRSQTLTATLNKRASNFTMLSPGALAEERAFRQSEDALKQLEESQKKFGKEFGEFNFVFPGETERFFFKGTRLGVSAESLTEQLAQYFGVKEGRGVLVTEVFENSAAAKAGLKAGDVIVAIDNDKVDGMAALINGVNNKSEGPVTLRIIRNRSEQTVTVNLEKREQAPGHRRSETARSRFFSTV